MVCHWIEWGKGGDPPYLETIKLVETKLTRSLIPQELQLLHEIALAFSVGGDGGPSQKALQESKDIQEHFYGERI